MATTTKLITGKDGELMVTSKAGVSIKLAEVDAFTAQVTVNNMDYQPIGQAIVYAVNTGYSVTLTLTEAIMRDDVMVREFIEELQAGFVPSFEFQGKLRRRTDGGFEYERVVFRDCVPDGTNELMNIKPGEIIKRSWTFRVNEPPEMMESFPA